MRRLVTLFSIAAAVLGGCIGRIGDPSDSDGPTAPTQNGLSCDPARAALTPTPIKRLPKVYFENSVREFLSSLDDATREALVAAIQPRLDLVPNDISDGYSNGDDTVSQDHVDAIFGVGVTLAAKIADASAPYADQLASVCGAGSDRTALQNDGCLTTFVSHYGRKAFRRPLQQSEIDDFKSFYQSATAAGVDGLAMLVGRFVAHPRFYYRFDDEGQLESGTDGVDAVYVLDKWELLSKVTFLFWAAPPTDALLDRVDATDITQDGALAQLVDDVLADAKAEQGVLTFYREWLQLDKTKTPATEGNVAAGQAMVAAAGIDSLPDTHREDMIQEVLDLADHYTLRTEGSLHDVLTSPYSFARTPALAAIYGVMPWSGAADQLVSFPDGRRAGLLTHAAFVASSAEYTRPVIKGKLIRTRILCTAIPPPPANLNIKPLTHPPDKTTRQALDEATGSTTCQACHSKMNALGYLSENFDPIGRLRDKELRFADGTADIVSQLPIDTAAAPAIEEGDTTKLPDAAALGRAIAASGDADACMVENYFQFVTGRAPDPVTDGCDLVGMRDQLTQDGGSIRKMLRTTVMQKSFRRRMVK